MKVSTSLIEALVVSDQLLSLTKLWEDDPEPAFTEDQCGEMEVLAHRMEDTIRETLLENPGALYEYTRLQFEITEEEHGFWCEAISFLREGWEWQVPWIDEACPKCGDYHNEVGM